jgi:hypothetical protein
MPVIPNVIHRTSCAGPQHKRKPGPSQRMGPGYAREAGEGMFPRTAQTVEGDARPGRLGIGVNAVTDEC